LLHPKVCQCQRRCQAALGQAAIHGNPDVHTGALEATLTVA
jgi:hypothetical protein